MLEIQVERTEDHTVCRPIGELDAHVVNEFREVLAGLVREPRFVIDLCEVPFMDSAALGALIRGIRRIKEQRGAVAVACNRPAVCQLLHTTGMDRIVGVFDSHQGAVESFSDNSGVEQQ